MKVPTPFITFVFASYVLQKQTHLQTAARKVDQRFLESVQSFALGGFM